MITIIKLINKSIQGLFNSAQRICLDYCKVNRNKVVNISSYLRSSLTRSPGYAISVMYIYFFILYSKVRTGHIAVQYILIWFPQSDNFFWPLFSITFTFSRLFTVFPWAILSFVLTILLSFTSQLSVSLAYFHFTIHIMLLPAFCILITGVALSPLLHRIVCNYLCHTSGCLPDSCPHHMF